ALIQFAFFVLVAWMSRTYPVAVVLRPKQKQTIGAQLKHQLPILSCLCVGFFIAWIAYSQWAATISTHTQELGISLNNYSLLWTINGGLIVLAQPLLAWVIRRWVTSLRAQMFVGFVFIILSFVVIIWAESFAMFAVAMTIITIGEMFLWPVVPTMLNLMAKPGQTGAYQGIANATGTLGRMIGPLFGSLIAERAGYGTLFFVLVICVLIAMFISLTGASLFRTYQRSEKNGEAA
ncbi:MAG: MFS transporter, partial [Bacilli bacterium]